MTTMTVSRPQRLGLTALAAGLVLVVLAVLLRSAPSAPATEPTTAVVGAGAPVQLADVGTGPIEARLTYSGSVEAWRQVTVSPRAGGQVSGVLVDTGSVVRTGDTLATLEGTIQRAQLFQAQAGLQAAQSRLDTMLAGSRTADVQAAQSQFDAAQARFQQLLTPTASMRLEADAAVKAAEATVENARGASERARAVLTSQIWLYCDIYLKFGLDCANVTLPMSPAAVKSLEGSLSSRFTELQSFNGQRAVAVLEANGGYIAALGGLETARAGLEVAKSRRDSLSSPSAADYAAARAAVDGAASALERGRTPFTNPELDGARAGVSQAQALVAIAQAAVDDTIIKAAFDGVVVDRNIDVGSLASPASPAFVLAASNVEVHLTVDESRVGLVRPGQPAELTLAAFPGRTFTATVASVAPSADARTHTFEVKLRAPDPDRALRAGMFAQVAVVTEQKSNALLVPAAAVVAQGNASVVFVVKDGRATLRPIRTGLIDARNVEVLDGLTAGERIVVVGVAAVRDGQPVTVTEAKR